MQQPQFTDMRGLAAIQEAFDQRQDRKGPMLNIYTTAGYPQKASTGSLLKAISEAGVDLIELGMPYSDPLADGETIQKSSAVAIANGITLQHIFRQVAEVRELVKPPIIMMGYYNQVLRFGKDEFIDRCVEVGIDGLILPDLPLDVYEHEFKAKIIAAGIGISFLVTPRTPDERVQQIDRLCRGFLYVVSSSSTTGTAEAKLNDQQAYFERLNRLELSSPKLIGFNISDFYTLAATTQFAQGGIIGSAFIRAIDAQDVVGSAKKFIGSLR